MCIVFSYHDNYNLIVVKVQSLIVFVRSEIFSPHTELLVSQTQKLCLPELALRVIYLCFNLISN